MSGWAGFSEAELRKMQPQDSAMPASAARGRKPVPANRSRQQLQREKALQVVAQKSAGASLCLPPGQQLTTPGQHLTKPGQLLTTPGQQLTTPGQQLTIPPPKHDPEPPAGAPAVRHGVQTKPTETKPAPEEQTPVVKELEKQEVALREKTRLEHLQTGQKIIEERNKRKKALLTKTIAEKSKQTQAEAVKLKRIQRELQALDDMVSNDIGILRGRIEQACCDYSTARKRYERAEVEYVTAKLDLHKKTEVKEQLTEHLCAIIQQNELRKAHKLEELMQQLQLQATEEELERQRQEEEEEKKIKHGVEAQGDGKRGADREDAVQSTGDRRPAEEEPVTEEKGGPEPRPTTEAPETEHDGQTLANSVGGGVAAS